MTKSAFSDAPSLALASLRYKHLEAVRAIAPQLRHQAVFPVQVSLHLLALVVGTFIRTAIADVRAYLPAAVSSSSARSNCATSCGVTLRRLNIR